MIDFVVYSLGCKVNQVEGQSLLEDLKKAGYSVSDSLVSASNYVINTCSVTNEADKKSRQMVARVKKLNEDASVFIMGCSSQNDAKKFAEKNGVVLVGGTSSKKKLLHEIIYFVESKNTTDVDINVYPLSEVYESFSSPLATRTRAYIKVQDGCNNFCSYCIVPYLRGRSRSRDLADVLSEAQEKSQTSKEIIVTGIDISDYKIDGKKALSTLVKELGKVAVRKRLGSLECRVVDEELLSSMQENNFCDHFHLSLQSGCDTVLKKMNRHYTTEEYYKIVQLLRKFYPKCSVTTDIIVGFPTETEEEFEKTVEFVKKVKFADAHIFPYSEREGTKAVTLKQVEKSIRVARANKLSAICSQHKQEFLSLNIGREMSVYAEENDGEYSVGHTSNYIKVYSTIPVGEIKKVKLTKLYKDGMIGE